MLLECLELLRTAGVNPCFDSSILISETATNQSINRSLGYLGYLGYLAYSADAKHIAVGVIFPEVPHLCNRPLNSSMVTLTE